ISAGTFIFCCGPWLPKIFPDLLGERIFPTRQEVFFLGTAAGNADFRPPKMPVWLHRTYPGLPYALPDIEGRGFKIAFDLHGEYLTQRILYDAPAEQRFSISAKQTAQKRAVY